MPPLDYGRAVAGLFRQRARLGGGGPVPPMARPELPVGAPRPEQVRYLLRARAAFFEGGRIIKPAAGSGGRRRRAASGPPPHCPESAPILP